MDTGRENFHNSLQLIHELMQKGVQHAVISPGSRSTPLTLACIKHPKINTHVTIDERSAGFFALGLAQQSDSPVVLICTTGTAVANWYPTVIEASYSKTPLILLSADRPEDLQNCGANQTIQQSHLFGQHVRYYDSLDLGCSSKHSTRELANRAIQHCGQPLPGPVHINLPFAEPLLPESKNTVCIDNQLSAICDDILSETNNTTFIHEQPATSKEDLARLIDMLSQGDGLIICGRDQYAADFPEQLMALAENLQVPVLADPLSNLRFGHHHKATLVHHYDSLFRSQAAAELKPDWMLRFGSFPVSKSLADYLSLQQCDCILVEAHGQNLDPIHACQHIIQADASDLCRQLRKQLPARQENRLLEPLKFMDQVCQNVITKYLQQTTKLDEILIIHELLHQLPDDCIVFSGNSMPIRDLNSFMTGYEQDIKQIDIRCNRGASGIDGNISSFAGHMMLDQDRPVIALLGDLSVFHDINGLLILRELSQQGYNGTLIILNNNGGGIFNFLAQKQLNDFETHWQTSTDLDFSHAADMFSLNYYKPGDPAQLSNSLSLCLKQNQVDIIEIELDAEHSVKIHQYIWQQIKQQLDS